jgi:hypothetical protein
MALSTAITNSAANALKKAGQVLIVITAGSTVLMSFASPANAAKRIAVSGNFAIQNAHNPNMVVDKYGDNPSVQANAQLYTRSNPATFTLRADYDAKADSYETKLASGLCFTADVSTMGTPVNGTLAVFKTNCIDSLNINFWDDGTVRLGRFSDLCLTNQGNRHSTLKNRLHWWACDGSPETKWNIVPAGQVTITNPPTTNPQNDFLSGFASKWMGKAVPSGVDMRSYVGQCVSLVTMYQREIGKRPGYFPGDYPVPAFRAFLGGNRAMAPEAYAVRNFNDVRRGDILVIGNSINDGFSHTAIAMGSQENGVIPILESNANNRAPYTTVTNGTLRAGRFVGALRY